MNTHLAVCLQGLNQSFKSTMHFTLPVGHLISLAGSLSSSSLFPLHCPEALWQYSPQPTWAQTLTALKLRLVKTPNTLRSFTAILHTLSQAGLLTTGCQLGWRPLLRHTSRILPWLPLYWLFRNSTKDITHIGLLLRVHSKNVSTPSFGTEANINDKLSTKSISIKKIIKSPPHYQGTFNLFIESHGKKYLTGSSQIVNPPETNLKGTKSAYNSLKSQTTLNHHAFCCL